MDSLAASILVAVAVVAEEWRQERRQEDYRLVVALSNSRPGLPEEPADLGQALEQAEDPIGLLFFLAQVEARTVRHLFTVRPFAVSGDISTILVDMVMEWEDLRHNMVSYEARYPAGMEVRNNLGDEIWEGLEGYRLGVAYFAFATLQQQRTDSIGFPEGLAAILNRFRRHMETYISVTGEEDDEIIFRDVHENLEDNIEDERDDGIEAQDGWSMHTMINFLHRQPIFWLAYNLYFPVDGRMSWEQASMWAIRWLRWTNMEAPAWPIQLRGLDVWNPDTTPIWNEALVELFADIRRRFRSTQTRHEAV